MASAPKTVVTNSSKRFHQFEIFGPMMSKKAGHSTKNANANAKGSPKRQSIRTIQNFVSQQTGARQTNRMPSNLERAYREYEAFASGRDVSEIHSYYNKTGKSAYTIENGRVVRDPNFTRDQDYYTYKAPYRDKEPSKYNAENYWGYGSFDKWVKGKNAPKYSQVNYWQAGTPESDMWNKYHNFRDPNWARDEKMLSTMSKEDADKWRSQHWSHDKLYENEAEFRKDKAKEARSAEQRYFARRDFINNQTPEEKQKYHDENYVTHHNKRNVLDRILGPLANNTLAQVAYAGVTGGDKSDAAKKSLGYMLPWTDDVSDRRYWSDVFKAIDDKLAKSGKSIAISPSGSPFAPIKTVSGEDVKNNTANAVVGLMMDVASDPLTYVSGGFSAGAKILKGTGATKRELDVARELARTGNDFASSESARIINEARATKRAKDAEQAENVTNQIAEATRRKKEINVDYLTRSLDINDAKKILLEATPSLSNTPKRLEEMAYELLQNYGRNIKGLRGANEGKGINVLGKEFVSAQKLRSIGDKTVAPLFNVANRKLRSTLGLAFSDKNKFLRYANKVGDEQAFSTTYAKMLTDKFGIADKNIKAGYMADQMEEFFTNASDDQIMDFILQHDKGTYRNMIDHQKTFDSIREKAAVALKDKNPELANRIKNDKDNLEILDNLTNEMYKKADQEMQLKKYKNFTPVIERRQNQLNRLIEARDAGIDVDGIDDLENQLTYLKQNEHVLKKHYKDIYQIYGKPITSLSFEETQNAIGVMKDLEDIIMYHDGKVPWRNLIARYDSLTAEAGKPYKEFRNEILEKYGREGLTDYLEGGVDQDLFAEAVRLYRDKLFDEQTINMSEDVINNLRGGRQPFAQTLPSSNPINSPVPPTPLNHVGEPIDSTPEVIHFDINKISQLLNHKVYRSAYRDLEQDLAEANKKLGEGVLDEMHSIMQKEYGMSATEVDDMMELYNNSEYQEMHKLLADEMAKVAREEVAAGRLSEDVTKTLFNKYIPREISEEAKQYWDNLFGEPFEEYIKQPGKFNPAQGEKMTRDQHRVFKTMEEGEAWWKKQVAIKYVKDIFEESGRHSYTEKDIGHYLKTHDLSKYPRFVEMQNTAGKLYNYNLSEIFMNRVIQHNELMQSDAINNLVKARLTDVYTGTKTSDKIVIPYIDMMQDCRRISGTGEFSDLATGQQVFDEIVSSVGLNPRLVGKNVSHFEVTPKQLENIQDQIKTALESSNKNSKRKITMKTQGYNMDNTVYNMLNRYTKDQTKILQSNFLNLYDTFLTKFKILNTVINPGFHGQNAPSNMFQSFLAIGEDAFNVKRIKQSIDIIRTGDPKQTITLNGKTYTYRQMKRIFEEYGVVDNTFYNDFKYTQEGSNLSESQLRELSMQDFNNFFRNDFTGKLSFLNPVSNVANIPFKGMGILGSSIEGAQRANLFMSCVNKGYNFREAVEMVNKFLFDYGDLTSQEQQIFKRIIPFYSFLRKNVPMELEAMLEQPHKFVNTRRTFDTISRMSEDYIPPDERNEYRDTDIQIPVKIDGSYYGISDNMPYTQFEKWTDINKAIGQTSPLVKLPIELATRRYAYTGMDIDSFSSYLMNQIPALKSVERHLHDKNFGSNPPDADPDYEPDVTRRRMWDIGQLIGFPINKIERQEYNKNYGDFYEQYENDPGTIADFLNIIRSRDINSVLDRYR